MGHQIVCLPTAQPRIPATSEQEASRRGCESEAGYPEVGQQEVRTGRAMDCLEQRAGLVGDRKARRTSQQMLDWVGLRESELGEQRVCHGRVAGRKAGRMSLAPLWNQSKAKRVHLEVVPTAL